MNAPLGQPQPLHEGGRDASIGEGGYDAGDRLFFPAVCGPLAEVATQLVDEKGGGAAVQLRAWALARALERQVAEEGWDEPRVDAADLGGAAAGVFGEALVSLKSVILSDPVISQPAIKSAISHSVVVIGRLEGAAEGEFREALLSIQSVISH